MNRLLLFALLISFETRADVAVYRTRLTGTITGNSNSIHATFSGFTVLDASTGIVARMQILTGKDFRVEQLSWSVTSARSKTRTFTLLIESTNFIASDLTSEEVFAKGANSHITLPGGQVLEVPKIFSMTTKSTYPENGNEFLQESSGMLVLDTVRTTQFGVPGGTVQGTIELMRADLIQRGYREITEPMHAGAQLKTEDGNFLTTEDGTPIMVDESSAVTVASK